MGLFKRRKKEEEIDIRSDIEKKFEEKGQEIGLKTGSIVQKGVDKFDKVKGKLEDDGTLDKLRNFGHKVDDKIDLVVDKVSKKGKEVAGKLNKKKQPESESKKDFYE